MIDTKEIPRWSLQDLLPGGTGDLEKKLAEIEVKVLEIEALRPQLSNDLPVEIFLEFLHDEEELSKQEAIVDAYCYLYFSENTQNQTALSLQDRMDQILTEVDNRTMFFDLWFKGLSDEAAQVYIDSAGELRYYLISKRRFKPYTLSEPEEKIINLKDVNGSEGLVKIYEILTNGLEFKLEIEGQEKTLTKSGLTQFYFHPSPEIRAATYKELFRMYGNHKTVLAQIYAYLVRDMRAEAVGLRGYASPISIRNLSNHLQDEVVDSLLDVCRQNSVLYQDYFKLKARMLGMDQLRRYDIYAPVAQSEKTIEFNDATELILDSFNQFSPRIAKAASRVFEENHLDAEIRPGKRSGAFNMSVIPKLTPWVLVNFTSRHRDVSTLAHELGHAVHGMLAADHSVLIFHAPLPLAETASVFGEMLVTDRLLREETDPDVQRDLLMSILDDSYATVQRQAYISIFEHKAHDRIAEGCTSDELAQCYFEGLTEQFGDAVKLYDEFAWEWITIPHIYTSPFYPYAYSFGQLMVLALYQQYLDEGESFIPRYLKLLSYGGSAEPQEILAEAGLDITSPTFWQKGFDVLRDKLDQLKEIVGGIQ